MPTKGIRITKMTIELCVWKDSYNKAEKEKGTTFKDIILKKIYSPCKECMGYDKNCAKYAPVEKK